MKLAAGAKLAHYEILEMLGAGGMGEVYLAHDSKLNRRVALKRLPADVAEVSDRLTRFKREAQAVAALNHPNVVQVYSVEEADGVTFMTLEHVRGRTLAEGIPDEGMDVDGFVQRARTIAAAVAAAHDAGITHRDLKPANIMITDEGQVKILDFGLARIRPVAEAASEIDTASMTSQGQVMGTLSYMSPEQAQGQPVDHRTDIFSLGVIFYEMATGQTPFQGESAAAVLAAILRDSPPSVSEQRSDLPQRYDDIIKRCLAKDRGRRYATAKEIVKALDEPAEEPASPAKPAAPWRWWWFVTPIGLAALAWMASTISKNPQTPIPRFERPIQRTSALGAEDTPVFSPNGEMIAYASDQSGNWDIWVARTDGGDAINRTADNLGDDVSPAWSPDGGELAYWSDTVGERGVFTIGVLSGEPRRITDDVGTQSQALNYPAWSSDGQRLGYVRGDVATGQVYFEILSLATGTAERSLLAGNTAFRYSLAWSPDEQWLAFVEAGAPCRATAGSLGTRCTLWVMHLESEESVRLNTDLDAAWSPIWSSDSRALYYVSNREGGMDLWRQKMDSDRGLHGEPVSLTAGMLMRSAALSPDGTRLAFSRGQTTANIFRFPRLDRPALWTDVDPITTGPNLITGLDPSPHGARLALSMTRAGNEDVWILDLSGGELERMTTHPAGDRQPRWSPDGGEIAFNSTRAGERGIWVKPLDGSPLRQVTKGRNFLFPDWSPDGETLVATSRNGSNAHVFKLPAEGGDAVLMSGWLDAQLSPTISPDGQWLAYNGGKDNERTLWIEPVAGGEARQLTQEDANWSPWSPDGRFLFFGRGTDIWEVSIDSGDERRLTDFRGRIGQLSRNFDSDGEYMYFVWREDVGDIWIMDVVRDENRR